MEDIVNTYNETGYVEENVLKSVVEKKNFKLFDVIEFFDKNLRFTSDELKLKIISERSLKKIENQLTLADDIEKIKQEREKGNEKRKKVVDHAVELYKLNARGEITYECPICYNSFLPNEVLFCKLNHAICKECCKNGFIESVANNASCSTCMIQGCKSFYTDLSIISILSKEDYIAWNRAYLMKCYSRKFFTCSACRWGGLVMDEVPKVFHCMRPKCRKEWCLICMKERDPKTHKDGLCSKELEESQEACERYISEVLNKVIRECPHCHKPQIKIEGCNRILCSCGHNFCYICVAKLSDATPYEHFGSGKPCPIQDSTESLAAEKKKIFDMGNKALADWKEKHPRFAGINLTKINTLINNFR